MLLLIDQLHIEHHALSRINLAANIINVNTLVTLTFRRVDSDEFVDFPVFVLYDYLFHEKGHCPTVRNCDTHFCSVATLNRQPLLLLVHTKNKNIAR